MSVHDGLEGFTWIRGVEGERLPAASYALLPDLKKGLFLATGVGSIFVVVCFLHTRGQKNMDQTPGRRPPRINVL